MKRPYPAAILAAVALALCTPAAHAQFGFFPTDLTITNVAYGGSGNSVFIVGFTSADANDTFLGPTNPVLNFGPGGSFNPQLTNLYNASQIIMNGTPDNPSLFFTGVNAFDNSKITLNPNSFMNRGLSLQNNSTLIMSGGQIGQFLNGVVAGKLGLADNSTATISGGTVFDLSTQGNSRATFSGGTIQDGLTAVDNSIVNVTGGVINGGVTVSGAIGTNGGVVNIGGATVNGGVIALSPGNIVINSGQIIGALTAVGGSIDFQGGDAASFQVSGATGTSYLEGGTLSGDANVDGEGSLKLTSGQVGGNLNVSGQGTTADLSGASVTGYVSVSQNAYVHIGTGAKIQGGLFLQDASLGTMDGGAFAGTNAVISLADQSTFNFNNGQAPSMELSNSAVALMAGGTVAGTVFVSDAGTLFLFGGSVNTVNLAQNGTAILSGGSVVAGISAANSARLTFAGATINGNVVLQNSAAVTITGGTVLASIVASDSTTIDVESLDGLEAIVGSISLHGSARLLVEGIPVPPPDGDFVRALARAAAGTPATLPAIYLYDNATIEIDGTQLAAQLMDPDSDGKFSEYALSGTLADGTVLPAGFELFLQNGSGASIQFNAPEPASLCPLALGAFALLARHGKKARTI